MDGDPFPPMSRRDQGGEGGDAGGKLEPRCQTQGHQGKLELPEVAGEGEEEDGDPGRKGGEEDGAPVGETGGYEAGTEERGAIAERDEKKKGSRLPVIQVKLTLDRGQERRQDDPGKEVDEEDEGKEKDGSHLPSEQGAGFLVILTASARGESRRHSFSPRKKCSLAARSIAPWNGIASPRRSIIVPAERRKRYGSFASLGGYR